MFNFDVSQIEWEKYLENYCIGTKQYALKEDMLRLPKAKQSLERYSATLVIWTLINQLSLLTEHVFCRAENIQRPMAK